MLAAHKLLDVVRARGVDPADVVRAARLDRRALADAEARIPLAADYELWRAAARLTGDDALSLAVARTYALDDYRELGFACSTAADVGEALERLVRFIPLWVRGQRYRLDGDRDAVVVTMQQLAPPHPAHRHADESALAQVVHAARTLGTVEVTPRVVRLAHAAPGDARPYRDAFGCRVEFGARANQVVWARGAVRVPTRRRDPALARFFADHCAALLAARAERRRLADDVRAELGDGAARQPAVARRLGTSERTLRRRLAADRTTYRALADAARRDAALRLLTTTDLSLADIAAHLGFADPGGLHRAVRRWTGRTPGALRR